MDEAPDLRAAICAFRVRAGLTQAGLASKLDVSERYIRAAEHGRPLGPRTLRRLACIMQKAGESDLARYISQMALSEHDYRALEARLFEVLRKLQSLDERLRNLEARRPEFHLAS